MMNFLLLFRSSAERGEKCLLQLKYAKIKSFRVNLFAYDNPRYKEHFDEYTSLILIPQLLFIVSVDE